MYPVLRTNYNQRSPTRVPAPCTDSMPGPSVHPPGRRATVACVLLPDVRSSARPVAQPVKAKHGGDGRGRRRGGARARACGAGAARRWLTCCLRRGPALGGPGCCNFAFSTTRAPVRLFLPSKLSHPLIYEWVGPNRGAEGVKHTLSSLGSAPQAQEGPTPRPRMRPRCSHSEADRTACSQAVRPAVAFACGIRSSRWLRCFSQSPVARGRRAR